MCESAIDEETVYYQRLRVSDQKALQSLDDKMNQNKTIN